MSRKSLRELAAERGSLPRLPLSLLEGTISQSGVGD
jgi:hypothetical protein